MLDDDFAWMRCDTMAETWRLALLLLLAFVMWPLVACVLACAIGGRWRRTLRRQRARLGVIWCLVTAAWCAAALGGVWWARGWT